MTRIHKGCMFVLLLLVIAVAGCDPSVAAYVAGADGENPARVNLFDGFLLQRRGSFLMFDASFTGGVRVASGDVNADGFPDLIGAAGPGGSPSVRVRHGVSGETTFDFLAYGTTFDGGVFVGAGDVNGDGHADIITGAGAGGGPHVKVFSGADASSLQSFFAYDANFQGGVTVAGGDVNGDGRADVITGVAGEAGPHVKVFDGVTQATLQSFFAYDTSFNGGVFVAAGDVNGDGRADVITGAGAGAGPHVKVFSGADGSLLLSFFAFDTGFMGGVRVAAGDVNSDGRADIIAGTGAGAIAEIRVFSGADASQLAAIEPFDSTFTDGIFVTTGQYLLSNLAALARE